MAPGGPVAALSKSGRRRLKKRLQLAQASGVTPPLPTPAPAPAPVPAPAAVKAPAKASAPAAPVAPRAQDKAADWASNWTAGDDDEEEAAAAPAPEDGGSSRIRVAPLELTVSGAFQALLPTAKAKDAPPQATPKADGEAAAADGDAAALPPKKASKYAFKKRSRQKNIRKDHRTPDQVRFARFRAAPSSRLTP